MTAEDRPSEPPPRPLFRHRSPSAHFSCPDPAEVAEEARWLAEPPVAAVACVPWRGGPGRGLLVAPSGVATLEDALIQEWLAGVRASGQVVVPSGLVPTFGALRALAVPMRSRTWTVGALALPLRAGWGPVARELESLGSEFARRFAGADRRAQAAFLRNAAVGRRPTGRRDRVTPPLNAPLRVRVAGLPRDRVILVEASGARRPEPPPSPLGRDGPLSLGRR